MNIGYALIRTKQGMKEEVYNKLTDLDFLDKNQDARIAECVKVYSQGTRSYSLIAKIEAKDIKEVSKFVESRIKTLEGIVETEVLLGIKF